MHNQFEIAAGTITGRDHLMAGRGNQDAYATAATDDALVAVVSDGCGSSPHSEFGSRLLVRLLIRAILDSLLAYGPECGAIVFPSFWEAIRVRALQDIGVIARSLGGRLSETVNDFLLATAVGAVIVPEATALFSIGDGIIGTNGHLTELGPFPGNAPPYLAYALIGSSLEAMDPDALKFKTVAYATPSVHSLVIGTDGVRDLIAAAEKPLPGKSEALGPLSQFWEQDRYFKNQDAIRRRLALANREAVIPDWHTRTIERHLPLLPDDTTLVVIRRIASKS